MLDLWYNYCVNVTDARYLSGDKIEITKNGVFGPRTITIDAKHWHPFLVKSPIVQTALGNRWAQLADTNSDKKVELLSKAVARHAKAADILQGQGKNDQAAVLSFKAEVLQTLASAMSKPPQKVVGYLLEQAQVCIRDVQMDKRQLACAQYEGAADLYEAATRYEDDKSKKATIPQGAVAALNQAIGYTNNEQKQADLIQRKASILTQKAKQTQTSGDYRQAAVACNEAAEREKNLLYFKAYLYRRAIEMSIKAGGDSATQVNEILRKATEALNEEAQKSRINNKPIIAAMEAQVQILTKLQTDISIDKYAQAAQACTEAINKFKQAANNAGSSISDRRKNNMLQELNNMLQELKKNTNRNASKATENAK